MHMRPVTICALSMQNALILEKYYQRRLLIENYSASEINLIQVKYGEDYGEVQLY